jgi:hypothetical protein
VARLMDRLRKDDVLSERMNPLLWKREHQLALLCAAVLGLIFGCLIGIWRSDPFSHWAIEYVKANGGLGWIVIPHSVLFVPLWSIFGAVAAAALVYIRQLLRD